MRSWCQGHLLNSQIVGPHQFEDSAPSFWAAGRALKYRVTNAQNVQPSFPSQKHVTIKLFVKSEKDGTRTPYLVTYGMRFQKTGQKKVYWTSTGYETQFGSKFGAKLSLPCPFFS